MRWSFAAIVLVPRGGRAPSPDAAARQRVFDWAAHTGFHGVELSPRWLDYRDFTPRQFAALRGEVEAAGLVVSGINLNRCIYTRTEQASRHVADTRRAIEAADALGARLVNISLSMPTWPTPERPPLFGADVPREEVKRAAAIVSALAKEAAQAGVALSMELHDDGMLDTAEVCLEFLRLVGRDNVGINPDVGNICRGPRPLPDWRGAFRMLASAANNWHVKNYRAFQVAPLWDGDLDYAEALRVMRAAGYDGWVSIESYSPDPLAMQEKALRWLKEQVSAIPSSSYPAVSK